MKHRRLERCCLAICLLGWTWTCRAEPPAPGQTPSPGQTPAPGQTPSGGQDTGQDTGDNPADNAAAPRPLLPLRVFAVAHAAPVLSDSTSLRWAQLASAPADSALANEPASADPNTSRAAPQVDPGDGEEPLVRLSSAATTLFGGVGSRDLLDPSRRSLMGSPGADVVRGVEAFARKTTDSGNLLRETASSSGVTTQQRTPIVTDTRLRGGRVGQVLASGSFWAPARMDLDTMMNKLDSQLVEDVVIIKGPYSSRYGPGFGFMDIQLIQSPRYSGGPELHGSTTIGYQTNGEQWAGRQSAWGGNDTSGFYVSYGHRTGVDYQAGDGTRIPSSYKSRDFFAALGHDLSELTRIEFNYLRLDQTDVEFPGLVYDINALVTNGYELRCYSEEGVFADNFFGEVWHNDTRFHGDTFRPSKAQQIPELQTILFSPDGVSGAAITNVASSSLGYRGAWTWEKPRGDITLGSDYTRFRQELNDIEIFLPLDDNNFPIPDSVSHDFGLFAEWKQPIAPRTRVTTGARIDYLETFAADDVAGVPTSISSILGADLPQEFFLWSVYGYGEHDLADGLTLVGGGGYAQRPPTLTELYATSPFIGTLQRGLTFVIGDPTLVPEKRIQLDVGVRARATDFRGGVQGYHAWVEDYITYDLFTASDPGGGLSAGAAFVNTDLATLTGFEAYGELDLTGNIVGFGNVAYVEGRDHSRTDRSGVPMREHEPLSNIPPLASLLGLRVHDGTPNSPWAVELSCRVVDNQDRIAASLEEVRTPGFTVWNVRSYCRVAEPLLLTFGVENFTNKFYQEHLDYRTGLGVFRPGVGFYFGSELVY